MNRLTAEKQVNEADHSVTVNGECYKAMINEFFARELENADMDDFWFQKDRSTSHPANETINFR